MAGTKPVSKPAKTRTGSGPRSGAPRSIVARTAILTSLVGRLTLAAIGAGAFVAAIVGFSLLRTRTAVTNLERGLYAQLATDAKVRLDRLTGRDRNRLMEAAFSDELYALVERGPAPPDSFLRPSFLDRFANQYGDRFIGLYDLSGKRLLAGPGADQADFESVATSNPFLRTLDNREPTVGFFRAGSNLYWIGGAPVLPTNYADATKPIRGYLVVVQPFLPSHLAPGTGERSARLELAEMSASKDPFRTQVATAGDDSVRIEFALPDVFAQQTTRASLTTSRGEFHAIDATFRNSWIIGLGLAGLFAFGLWFVATRYLVSPAVKTSAALSAVHQGDIPHLINSPSGVSEWTTMVGAINRLISNGRTKSERFDRLTGVVAEGSFERDLLSAEWTVGSRFGQMLGGIDAEADPLEAIARVVHPDDADQVIPWLQSEAPAPRRLSALVRMRRPNGGDWWGRFEAEVGTDLAGQPIRITGRLRDETDDRTAEARRLELAAGIEARGRRQGRLLRHLGLSLRESSGPSVLADRLELTGQAIDRVLAPQAGSFDLHGLMQESLGSDGNGIELLVVPGVPSTVSGDRGLVKTILEALLAMADPTAGRVTLRAEQADKHRPAVIRLVVEDRRTGAVAGLKAALEQSETDDAELRLDTLMIHHLARALGGSTSAEANNGLTRFWVDLPLPGVETPAAPAQDADGPPSWETTSESASTFEPALPPAPAADSSPPRVAVAELVADETILIDLDAAPVALLPVSGRIRAALEVGNQATLRTARIALSDTPIRLTELRGAIRAGESRTVAQIAQAIRTFADALEATPMARRCSDILDAVEGQYLESADYLSQALDNAWQEVERTIAPYLDQTGRAPLETSAIDPATLEQLTATISSDGLGLGNQLVSLFLAEAPARLDTAERAHERADLGGFKSAVSDLKGMCGLIGATRLAEHCSAAAQLGHLPDVGPMIGTLRAELRRVYDVLEPLLGVKAGA